MAEEVAGQSCTDAHSPAVQDLLVLQALALQGLPGLQAPRLHLGLGLVLAPGHGDRGERDLQAGAVEAEANRAIRAVTDGLMIINLI